MLNDSKQWKYRFVFRGNSMRPLLSPGDTVIAEMGEVTKKLGDLAIYKKPDITECHRIVRIICRDGKQWYLTKGDNNIAFDELLEEEMILGKVSLIYHDNILINVNKPLWKKLSIFIAYYSYVIGGVRAKTHVLLKYMFVKFNKDKTLTIKGYLSWPVFLLLRIATKCMSAVLIICLYLPSSSQKLQ